MFVPVERGMYNSLPRRIQLQLHSIIYTQREEFLTCHDMTRYDTKRHDTIDQSIERTGPLYRLVSSLTRLRDAVALKQ